MAVDGTIVSVKEITSQEPPSIFIYPNPTAAMVQLEGANMKTVKVFDLKGQLVFSEERNGLADRLEINLAKYPDGIYLVEVHSLQGVVRKKIIKR